MAATNTTLTTGQVSSPVITLTASTVDTVTFADDCDRVQVQGDGTADIFYTVDGSTPAVNGPKSYRLPSGVTSSDEISVPTAGGTVVKLISSGAAKYSVHRRA